MIVRHALRGERCGNGSLGTDVNDGGKGERVGLTGTNMWAQRSQVQMSHIYYHHYQTSYYIASSVYSVWEGEWKWTLAVMPLVTVTAFSKRYIFCITRIIQCIENLYSGQALALLFAGSRWSWNKEHSIWATDGPFITWTYDNAMYTIWLMVTFTFTIICIYCRYVTTAVPKSSLHY